MTTAILLELLLRLVIIPLIILGFNTLVGWVKTDQEAAACFSITAGVGLIWTIASHLG